jgi:hypothetical protein
MSWRIRELMDKAFDVSLETSAGEIRREIRAIFADKDVPISAGKTALIPIVPFEIPKNFLSFLGGYARHPLGNTLSLVEEHPKRLDEARTIRKAAFHAWANGRVEKGDVIGVVVMTFMGQRRKI